MLKKEILFVDAYNMIGSWPNLVPLKQQDRMEDARELLLREMSNFAKYRNIQAIVVFDAQLVPGMEQKYDYDNLKVVFTQEDETADSYIERSVEGFNTIMTHVTVATSDYAEQRIILNKGATRKAADELYQDIQHAKKALRQEVDAHLYASSNKRMTSWKDGDLLKLAQFYQELARDDQLDKKE